MKEEIKEQAISKLGEIISYIETGAKSGADFVAEQTPLLIQEILTFNLISSLFWAGLMLFVVVGLFYITFGNIINDPAKEGVKTSFAKEVCDTGDGCVLLGFLTVLYAIAFFAGVVPNIIESFKIYFAPRLYLIEYVAELTKSIN